jgi:PAS domain S-box-containing protein
MKPLRNRRRDFFKAKGSNQDIGKEPAQGDNLIPMIEDLEQSLGFMHGKLNEMRITNIELNSKVGVMNFEKNQFVRILDSINFGILITDMHNNIRNINEYMLKLFDRKREAVVDHPLEEVLRHDDLVSFIIQQDTIEYQGNMNYQDMSFPDQAQGEVFRVTLSHFMGAEGTPIGKVITFRNITSIKMVQKAQQEFIAHVAHELRTPLTNIKSYSEMLMDQEVESAEMQKEFYNTINQETTRLADLVQSLMSLSKMEMGGLILNKGLLRTDWLVDGSLSAVEASARDKRITIEKKLPDVFPSIMADKELLKSAIINVLGNAVKYTPADGKIIFCIFEQDNTIVIEITDTGYGLAPEDLPHVFEKFYRSNNPQVAQQTGSGLGLAIAAEIVHLHNGEIEVQSKLGEGSRFTIKIPKEDYLLGNQ